MSKKTSQPLVSFVVVNWNTINETTEALQSIFAQNYSNFEVILVDNGSEDGSKEYFSKRTDLIYVDLPKNTGFTGGHIAGNNVASGEYIALINSDAVLDPDWTKITLETMVDKTVAAVGGRAYTWNENEVPFDTSNKFYSYQIVDHAKGYVRTMQTGEQTCEVDSISGAAVLVRKSVIDKYGYLDDDFFCYYEETDLFARYKRAGYKVIYEPRAAIWHKVGVSSKGDTVNKSYSYFYLYQMQRNRFLFAIKSYDSAQARYFFRKYVLSGLKAHLLYLRHKNIEHKAQYKALYWNLRNLSRTLKKRAQIKTIGNTYNDLLSARTLPTDITIVMPCYNYADYVVEALESLKKQLLKPSHVLVINDGSTDNSLEVLKKYQKSNPSVEVYDQENAGVVATKNRGLSMVRTTWTIFFDADDIMKPDYIKKVMQKAQESMAEITYTDMEYFGHITGIHKARRFNMNALLKSNFIHNSALIATDRLLEIGGYKPEMAGGYEDWELYISLAETGAKFAYVPEPVFLYRQREVSRNIEAKIKAERLHQTVYALHAGSYRRYNRSALHYANIAGRVVQNPGVVVVAIYSIPFSILSGVRGFFGTARRSYAYRVRNYLHKRDQENYEDD